MGRATQTCPESWSEGFVPGDNEHVERTALLQGVEAGTRLSFGCPHFPLMHFPSIQAYVLDISQDASLQEVTALFTRECLHTFGLQKWVCIHHNSHQTDSEVSAHSLKGTVKLRDLIKVSNKADSDFSGKPLTPSATSKKLLVESFGPSNGGSLGRELDQVQQLSDSMETRLAGACLPATARQEPSLSRQILRLTCSDYLQEQDKTMDVGGEAGVLPHSENREAGSAGKGLPLLRGMKGFVAPLDLHDDVSAVPGKQDQTMGMAANTSMFEEHGSVPRGGCGICLLFLRKLRRAQRSGGAPLSPEV